MAKNLLLKHYIGQKKEFHKYFDLVKKGQDMEDIHQLRVSIKKLRAIWSLLEVITKGKIKKSAYNRLISKLFKSAGKLREAQVNLKILRKKKTKYLKGVTELYHHRISLAGQSLMHTMHKFNHAEFKHLDIELFKNIKSPSNNQVLRLSSKYILNKIYKINKLKNQLPDIDKLHKIRIQLRIVNEILLLIKSIYSTPALGKLRKEIKILNHKIGKWHDYTVLIPKIEKFAEKQNFKRSKKHLYYYILRLESSQSAREEKIRGLLDNYFTKAKLKPLRKMSR